jgi:hypothetical protein
MKDYKILQHTVCTDPEDLKYELVLIIIKENSVQGIFSCPIPDWHRYWDEKYQYYPPSLN